MPILSKQQLLQENNTNFPNNNDQLITPALLRQFNTDMIDSMQLTQSMAGYAVLSGSNSFIGNQNILGDLSIVGTLTATTIHTITESASVIYSSGSNQLGDELTDTQILSGSVKIVGNLTVNGLPIFTGSVTVDTGSLLTTASFNAYTQSNDQRVSSLEANTASVNTSISALNNFTQSQQALNGTFATTGSNTFTGNQIIDKANVLYTNGIYWNDTTPGYTNLEIINQAGGNLDFASLNGGRMRVVNTPLILTGSALTSSNDISTSANIYAANLTGSAVDTGSLVTTASFNAYTQSNDTIVSSLVVTTNAQQILINNLNAASASLFTSASNALVTASLSGQTLTFTKGDNSTFGITIPDVSGSDISALNAFTASQLQINSGYNTFTQSIQAEVDSLQAATSSYALSASVAAVDAAQQAQINSLINATSSYADSASFAASQLAQDIRIDGLSAQTASYAISASVAAVDAAQQSQINSLIAATSSYVTESETGSFARYDVSNPWSADQTFTNISAVSASFQYVQTIFETASVIYSSGSNQFGDAADDVQTLYGSVRVMNELTASGLNYPTADNGEESFMQTDGNGNLSLQYVKTLYQNIRNMESVTIQKGTPLFVSGSTGDNANVYIADAGNPLRMPATLIAGDNTLAPSATGKGIIFGHIEGVDTTGFPAGTEVYVGVGGSWTATRPTGSTTPVQPLGVVTREGNNGMGIVLTQVPFDLPNLETGYVWVGNGNNQAVSVATSSFIEDLSGYTTTASFNAFTQSADQRLTAIESVSGSWITESETGSFATTGSNTFVGIQNFTNEITASNTFINGDLTVLPTTVTNLNGNTNVQNFLYVGGGLTLNDTAQITWLGSGSIGAGFSASVDSRINAIVTGTGFATTGSNTFVGNQIISGNVDISGELSASLQQGYVWVGDANGRTTTVATSSFGGGSTIDTGSFLTTGSAYGTQTVFGTLQFNVSESAAQAGIVLFNTGSDASGSMEFGVTGPGNPFIKLKKRTWFQIGPRDEIYYPEFTSSFDNGIYVGSYFSSGKIGLLATSGSLGLFGGNPTANRVLTNIQTTPALANSATNLVFVNNTGTTTTIVSGSNNIWTNPINVTAGFNRYIGGSNNIFTGALPQLTGSAAFSPAMNNNFTATGMIMRTPVSASAYNINSNVFLGFGTTGINLGISAANNFERATNAFTMNNNIVAGNINTVAFKTPLSSSISITNNMVGGAITANMDSSSISFSGNSVQGALTINNSYFPSTYNATSAQIGVNGNLSIGGHTIYASGSNATFTAGRAIQNNAMIGAGNVISASLNGDNSNVVATMLFGQALNVIGSNARQVAATMPDYGSVFVGRWNAFDGNRGLTGPTVFAVGTGNGAANRKTGFLIDSGSNTFIEGTLNVSGSTFITGGITVTNPPGQTSRFTSIDADSQRIATTLAFTSSRFLGGGAMSSSVDMENLNGTTFGFNQLDLTDNQTGAKLQLQTNKALNYTEVKLNAVYTGSASADVTIRNTNTTSTFTVNADTSDINSSVNISETLKLAQQDPLPTGATGMLAVSASVLWFYDATQWRQVSLI